MNFSLDQINVTLKPEGDRVCLTTQEEHRIFSYPMEEIKAALEKNYPIVKDHYMGKRGSIVSDGDLNDICLIIVLLWYQSFGLGQSEKRKDMNAILRDRKQFDQYATEIIVNHFRKKYPDDFTQRCLHLTDIKNKKELMEYIDRREEFYNK